MKECEKYIINRPGHFLYSGLGFIKEQGIREGWKNALEWYQNCAKECEPDCSTNKDFKILYFHLKQVLENELNNV